MATKVLSPVSEHQIKNLKKFALVNHAYENHKNDKNQIVTKPILPKDLKESVPVECRVVRNGNEVLMYQTFETKKGHTFGKYSKIDDSKIKDIKSIPFLNESIMIRKHNSDV